MNTTNNHSQNMSIENMPTSEPCLQGNVGVGPSSPRGNEEKPILTIIIPTYNMEKYLRHCLDSLIVPNMDKVEVLVINDGSKDSSSAIGHEYQDNYPQTFRVIDKENGNYGSCINRGLKEATGKYVKVLDSDDWFDTKIFAEYVDFLKDKDQDLIITDYTIRYSNNKVTEHTYPFKVDVNLKMKDLASARDFQRIEMHAVTYKTENLRSIGYKQTEGISYTDQEWIFWPMTTIKDIVYFNHSLYQYRMGREGQTVDVMAMLNHFDQVITVQMNALRDFSSGKDYGNAKTYLDARLKYRFQFIYNKNTVIVYNNLVNKPLKKFDDYLKDNYKELYDYVDQEYILDRHLPVHFVRAWRNNNKLTLKLCYVLIKFIRLFK